MINNDTICEGVISGSATAGVANSYIPDPFAFVDKTNQPAGATILSNIVTLSGFNVPQNITLNDPEFSLSINGGPFINTSYPQVVGGDTIQLRCLTPSTFDTTVSGLVTINGVSDTWLVSTMAAGADNPPVITVLGNAVVDHLQGVPYVDAGATALDDLDGDITNAIIVGGDPVDINTFGHYTITYNVQDSSGRWAAQKIRTVNIVAMLDSSPDAFSFTDQLAVPIGPALVTSDTVQLSGFNANISLDIDTGEVNINGGVWQPASSTYTVKVNDIIQLRQYSSALELTESSIVITIGNQTDTWTIKTVQAPTPDVTPPIVTPPTDISIDIAVNSAGLSHTDNRLLNWLATATATDETSPQNPVVSNNISILSDPLSLGTYSVNFWATDDIGNTGNAFAALTVQEYTPNAIAPTFIVAPSNLTVSYYSNQAGVPRDDLVIQTWVASAEAVDDEGTQVVISNTLNTYPAILTAAKDGSPSNKQIQWIASDIYGNYAVHTADLIVTKLAETIENPSILYLPAAVNSSGEHLYLEKVSDPVIPSKTYKLTLSPEGIVTLIDSVDKDEV